MLQISSDSIIKFSISVVSNVNLPLLHHYFIVEVNIVIQVSDYIIKTRTRI